MEESAIDNREKNIFYGSKYIYKREKIKIKTMHIYINNLVCKFLERHNEREQERLFLCHHQDTVVYISPATKPFLS